VLHDEFSAYSCLVSLGDRQAGCLYERGQGFGRAAYEKIIFARFTLKDLVQNSLAQPES
jgi:hypothetical protein